MTKAKLSVEDEPKPVDYNKRMGRSDFKGICFRCHEEGRRAYECHKDGIKSVDVVNKAINHINEPK